MKAATCVCVCVCVFRRDYEYCHSNSNLLTQIGEPALLICLYIPLIIPNAVILKIIAQLRMTWGDFGNNPENLSAIRRSMASDLYISLADEWYHICIFCSKWDTALLWSIYSVGGDDDGRIPASPSTLRQMKLAKQVNNGFISVWIGCGWFMHLLLLCQS